MSDEAHAEPEPGPEEHQEEEDHHATSPSGSGPNAIDVVALAERVYQLMRAEVRLEQARLGYSARSGRWER